MLNWQESLAHDSRGPEFLGGGGGGVVPGACSPGKF